MSKLDETKLSSVVDGLLKGPTPWADCKRDIKKEFNLTAENKYSREVERLSNCQVTKQSLTLWARVLMTEEKDCHSLLLAANFQLMYAFVVNKSKNPGEQVQNYFKFGHYDKTSEAEAFADRISVQIRGSNTDDISMLKDNAALKDWFKKTAGVRSAVFLSFNAKQNNPNARPGQLEE